MTHDVLGAALRSTMTPLEIAFLHEDYKVPHARQNSKLAEIIVNLTDTWNSALQEMVIKDSSLISDRGFLIRQQYH